jgi:hypothetical protein
VGDKCFTVQFKTQPDKDIVKETLEKTPFSDLKNPKALEALAKGIVEGKTVSMTCHLVKMENNLGRSTVIDLTSATDNKFRQIDHRSIDHLIFNNTKYLLKKGAKKVAENDEEEKKEAHKWNARDLAVGNWFSATNYFKTKEQDGDQVMTVSGGTNVAVSMDILAHEMDSASVYAKEEKLALTKVVKILKEAHSTAFTICFTCKVDEKQVQEKLKSLTAAEFKDAKTVAKEVLTGKETTVVGRLSKTEGNLGRSLVVGLDGFRNYASVDHRTIKSLIIKNVKYVV